MARHRQSLAVLLAACALQIPLVASAQSSTPAEAYASKCADCHGAKGQGSYNPKLGPALKGNPFVVNGSVNAIANVIRKGRSGKSRLYDETMPNMPSIPTANAPEIAAFLKGDLQK